MHEYILLFGDIREAFDDGQAEEIPELDVDAIVGLVRLVDGRKVEVDVHVLGDLSRIGEQLAERREDVMVRAVVVELDLSDEFEPYALMLDLCARFFQLYVHCAAHVFAVVVDELFYFLAVFEHFD